MINLKTILSQKQHNFETIFGGTKNFENDGIVDK